MRLDIEDRSVLTTPAVGSAMDDLVIPCGKMVRRSPLPQPPRGPAIAVALSGGGFRATLSGLGVLRFLADAGLLAQVRVSSSVSGGSVANGMFGCGYRRLSDADFRPDAFDEYVLRPVTRLVTERSLSRGMIRQAWKALGGKSRTDLLAGEFDRLLFGGQLLERLPLECRFIINAANTSTAARFGFEAEALGDYVIGEVPTAGTGLSLAQAVAASAAVPGVLAPVVLRGIAFPCQRGRTVRLVDGGTYDNSALEPIDRAGERLIVALNAGGLFVTGRYGRIPVVRDLKLAESLLYRQSTALRRRAMVERFRAREQAIRDGEKPPEWSRRGVLFGLGTSLKQISEDWTTTNPRVSTPAEVALVKTSFDRFPQPLAARLVYTGWWLAGATLATYHRDVLPAQLPYWRALP
ncbi:MAG TPA: patatin-like phospholipase family protein [Micromonosporaceae bacterium]|jgi:NTE family protein|nr:patatin-like phospholipase family protein [Micromonosporaceae bacterium]